MLGFNLFRAVSERDLARLPHDHSGEEQFEGFCCGASAWGVREGDEGWGHS